MICDDESRSHTWSGGSSGGVAAGLRVSSTWKWPAPPSSTSSLLVCSTSTMPNPRAVGWCRRVKARGKHPLASVGASVVPAFLFGEERPGKEPLSHSPSWGRAAVQSSQAAARSRAMWWAVRLPCWKDRAQRRSAKVSKRSALSCRVLSLTARPRSQAGLLLHFLCSTSALCTRSAMVRTRSMVSRTPGEGHRMGWAGEARRRRPPPLEASRATEAPRFLKVAGGQAWLASLPPGASLCPWRSRVAA